MKETRTVHRYPLLNLRCLSEKRGAGYSLKLRRPCENKEGFERGDFCTVLDCLRQPVRWYGIVWAVRTSNGSNRIDNKGFVRKVLVCWPAVPLLTSSAPPNLRNGRRGTCARNESHERTQKRTLDTRFRGPPICSPRGHGGFFARDEGFPPPAFLPLVPGHPRVFVDPRWIFCRPLRGPIGEMAEDSFCRGSGLATRCGGARFDA